MWGFNGRHQLLSINFYGKRRKRDHVAGCLTLGEKGVEMRWGGGGLIFRVEGTQYWRSFRLELGGGRPGRRGYVWGSCAAGPGQVGARGWGRSVCMGKGRAGGRGSGPGEPGASLGALPGVTPVARGPARRHRLTLYVSLILSEPQLHRQGAQRGPGRLRTRRQSPASRKRISF